MLTATLRAMKRGLILMCCVLGAGCGGGDSTGDADAAAGVVDAADDPDAAAARPDADVSCPGATTVFINGLGVRYEPGPIDPIANTTTLLTEANTFTAADLEDDEWQSVMSCVSDLVAGYNIVFTETDPSPAPHHEMVLTQDPPNVVGLDPSVTAISPLLCDDFYTVAFVFRVRTGVYVRDVCERIVDALLYAAHVDTLRTCESLPSLLAGCGPKSIVDGAFKCGTTEDRECRCGQEEINPHQAMVETFGTCP